MMKENINIYNSEDEYLAQMKSGALLNPRIPGTRFGQT